MCQYTNYYITYFVFFVLIKTFIKSETKETKDDVGKRGEYQTTLLFILLINHNTDS